MTTFTWGAWSETAKANSTQFGPTIPEGQGYTGEIINAGARNTKSGKPQLWWDVKILVGPYAGKQERLSQTLSPENPKALAAFYGVLSRLGIDPAQAPDGTPPEAIAKLGIGTRITFDFSHRADGDRVYSDFKNIKQIDTVVSAPAPVAVPPAAVPAVAEAAAAPAVVAPAVETPQPTPEQIAAFLAAQQQAAPAAPAAPAVTVTPPAPGTGLPF